MMGWPLLILCYAAKQHQLYGLSDSMLVSVAIQLVYITKFFHWEMGYMKTLDIMHDRAGFYLVRLHSELWVHVHKSSLCHKSVFDLVYSLNVSTTRQQSHGLSLM